MEVLKIKDPSIHLKKIEIEQMKPKESRKKNIIGGDL